MAALEDKVAKLLKTQQTALAILGKYRDINAQRLEENDELLFELAKALEVAIQTTIDIASRLIAHDKLPVALTYAQVFQTLGKEKVLDAEMADQMIEIAKFRNVLVHLYQELDLELLCAHIRQYPDAIRRCTASLGARLGH